MTSSPIRSERPERRIQKIQQFVNDKIGRDQIFEEVSKELSKIADTLQQGRLTVQIEQFNAQMSTQLTLIEDVLKEQKRKLETELQRDKSSWPRVGGDRRDFEETIRVIYRNKESDIKRIESSVNQSVTDLLNICFHKNILSKLRSYVDTLEPEIVNQIKDCNQTKNCIHIKLVKRTKTRITNINYLKIQEPNYNNYPEVRQRSFFQKIHEKIKLTTNLLLSRYFGQSLSKIKARIELAQENSEDANTAITKYYRDELRKWTANEWKNVCDIYNEGGLKKISQTTYETLNSNSSLKIEEFVYEPSQCIDTSHIFAEATTYSQRTTSYERIPLLKFIFSKIRNQLTLFLTISFLLSILGATTRRQFARWIFQPVFSAFEYAAFPTVFILLFVIYFLFKALLQTYYKHNLVEIKRAEVRLKDEIFQLYLNLIRDLTNRIRQQILSAIEAEDQRLDENVQAYRKLLDQTIKAAESDQMLINERIEERQRDLKKLNQELTELQRLTRQN